MSDSAKPQSEKPVRFAVLRHTDRCGTHYDLMIDRGERLATWRCPRPPEQSGTGGQTCTRIADHRRVYLDYEGPVSGNRGHVVRHDGGGCIVHSQQEDAWKVVFHGDWLTGRYLLERRDVETLKRRNVETSKRQEVGTSGSRNGGSPGAGAGRSQSWLLRAQ